MALNPAQVFYYDINTNYGLDGKVELVENDAAVINTIVNIIRTVPRSRLFRPTFGSRAWYFLQQPASAQVAQQLGTALISDISEWQPLITVIPGLTYATLMTGGGGYNLSVGYSNLLTGQQQQTSLSLVQQPA